MTQQGEGNQMLYHCQEPGEPYYDGMQSNNQIEGSMK